MVKAKLRVFAEVNVDWPWNTTFPAFIILLLFWCHPVLAIPVEELDPDREWRLKRLSFSGNENFSSGELKGVLSTQERPWYAPWRARPAFEPGTFSADLERLIRFYQSKGYYEAKVTYDLDVDREQNLVTPAIQISEGQPVRVTEIALKIVDFPELEPKLRALLPKLPLAEGKVFSEEAYQQTEAKFKEFFYDRSRARVEIQRRAEVILDQHQVRVFYTLTAGPETSFGTTTVEGVKDVSTNIVLRELTYKPGEPFSGKAVKNTE
jgi:outer membrane protein assembly factor BamA